MQLAAVALNGNIYVIGGVNASNQIQNIVEVYDPVANTWSTAASDAYGALPAGGCGRTRMAEFTPLGGSTSSTLDMTGYSSVVEAYNPATNSWATVTPMNTPRVGLAAAASGGRIYAFGGYGRPPGIHGAVSAYCGSLRPGQQHLEQLGIDATMRAMGLAAVPAPPPDLIYLIGGKNESSVPPANNEEYIPSSGTSS